MRAADAYRARKREEEDCVLVAELEHPIIARLTLKRSTRLDAATWRATPKTGGGTGTAIKLEQIQPSPGDERVFVSIHQRKDGRHDFVKLEDALRGRSPLVVLDEADVKDGNRLFYARPRKQSSLAQLATVPTKLWDHPDLAPHGTWTNYSVVPWLCLGRTAAVLLSDEETLCRELPEERIFEHLRLVINCHQARALRPYKAAKTPPEVIAHAVHTWYSTDRVETNRKIDAINERVYAVLQDGGSVAIHCLAGIHRAAMITACHFLWRHHVLGHTSISCDRADVYRKLISVRPHVSPAYEDILRGYGAHLLEK
jgi:hypothetical protein